MLVQKVRSRKEVIAKILAQAQGQDFYTTYNPWSSRSPHRLLILDSSFNPPTKAHASLLSKALASKPLGYFDASLLLFSANNVDKKLTGASVLQRAQMMELMAQSFDQEVAVGFTPFGKFVDKAQAIQSWFKTPVELYFILGYDTITRLFDPKYYSPVSVKEALAPFFKTCHLICADRGDNNEDFWKGIEQKVDRIQLDPNTAFISSTLARSLLASSREDGKLNDILDPHILEFIRDENMYE